MVLGNLACVTHGAAIVIPAPSFDAASTLAAVQSERCTSLYGVPDERYGEQLCAWVVVAAGATSTADELKAHCAGKIAHYKIPYYVKFVDDLPMTVTGKIQKFKMRETSACELGLEGASAIRTA